jgi:hypothetical protein
MDATTIALTLSLALLTGTLGALSARGIVRFTRGRTMVQLMWGMGLGLGAVATALELVVYVGFVDRLVLQAYVFLSAAIVGVLSLGSTRVLRSPRFERGYTAYIVTACGVVGFLSFTTPMPGSMVVAGVVSGNPPLLLLVLSSFITVPATFVLLGAVVVSLRKTWRWQTFMMGVGACVLATGGALYIASFPIALYYSEFIGIVLIFVGLANLPHATTTPATVVHPFKGKADSPR